MKFYEEAPEKEDVIKNAYIAEIRGYAKYADEYGSLEQAVEQTVVSIEWLSDTLNWDIEVWTADGGYPELVNSAK